MKKFFFFLVVISIVGWAGMKYYKKRFPPREQNPSAQTNKNIPAQNTTSPASNAVKKVGDSSSVPETKNVTLLDEGELTDAIHLFKKGEFKKAMELFEKEIGKADATPEQKSRNLAYLSKCHEYTGNKAMAEKIWKTLLQEYPQSPYCGDAQYFLAVKNKEEGLQVSELKYLEESAKFHDSSIGGRQSLLELGAYHLKKGEKIEAWKWYSQAVRSGLPQDVKRQIRKILDPLVQELLYSPQMPGLIRYPVRRGDSMERIAKKHNTSVGFLCLLNKKSDTMIRVGEELKVVASPIKIEVYKKSFLLVAHLENGLYLQGYDVGLGKHDKTPVGEFTVKVKQKNPPWYTEENGKMLKIPFGDPRNVLGTRWMGFQFQGYGIHGTQFPESIGKSESNGCVRMRNEEVEKLYEIVPYGTPVTIKNSP